MNSRFVKIGADGAQLPADAGEWVAVLDNETQLVWTVATVLADKCTQAEALAKKTEACGFSDWRLPTRKELLSLVDDTRYNPAIDTAFFPNTPTSDWFWTATPAASSPAECAWGVFFYDGSAYWYDRGGSGFVRAVRSSQS